MTVILDEEWQGRDLVVVRAEKEAEVDLMRIEREATGKAADKLRIVIMQGMTMIH